MLKTFYVNMIFAELNSVADPDNIASDPDPAWIWFFFCNFVFRSKLMQNVYSEDHAGPSPTPGRLLSFKNGMI